MPHRERGSVTVIEVGAPEAEIESLVGLLQRALVEHPVASQSLIAGLVAEGRRFARTPNGMAWLRRLQASELSRQARVVWESSALSMIDERADPPLPTALVDAALGAMRGDELEALLRRTHPFPEALDE